MRTVIYFLYFLLLTTWYAGAQSNSAVHVEWKKLNSKQQLQTLTFTTPGYRKEALKLMIEDATRTPAYQDAVFKLMLKEANVYASRLNLPENLPLTTNSVKERYITTPHLAVDFGALGSFRTTNYSYGFGKGRHLSYITRIPKDKSKKSLYDKFAPWAIDSAKVNTNAAYMMATQFLAKAFVDLSQLPQKVSIEPIVVRNRTTSIYNIEWERGGSPAVEVTLSETEGQLWTLRVEDPQLILRPEISVNSLLRGDSTQTKTAGP